MYLVSRRINVSAGYMQINLSSTGGGVNYSEPGWNVTQLVAITSHKRNGPWEGTIMIGHHGQVSSGQWECQDMTGETRKRAVVLEVYMVGVGLLTTEAMKFRRRPSR
jgi:hypothetical protein